MPPSYGMTIVVVKPATLLAFAVALAAQFTPAEILSAEITSCAAPIHCPSPDLLSFSSDTSSLLAPGGNRSVFTIICTGKCFCDDLRSEFANTMQMSSAEYALLRNRQWFSRFSANNPGKTSKRFRQF